MSSESDKKTLSLVALGPGCENLLTYQAESEIKDADIIFGAERVLKTVQNIKSENSDTEKLYEAEKIAQYLKNNEKYKRAVVCFSGDAGFFSGAQAFYEKTQSLFSDWKVSVFPGVSSVQYFASKLGRAWQNWNFLSLHGSKCNFIEEIRKNELNFLILSGKKDLEVIRKKLDTARKNGLLSDFNCYIGSNLSYDVEKIGQFESFNDSESSLFVLLIENSSAKANSVLPVLNDSDFLRAEKIPITKKEVRQLSVCSLGLSEKSVLYDIGCGSGSVSVEAARIALKGRVISIDCNEDAVLLTQK
ncbi:precorrin-6y C5,15-methyltransferase (decarboxylating) subunit CbiE, partial [Treponema sp.]|uniref:precorrin-6y C5,15-methyltransferase (decarboxylating) subunit CbiE n=1 Tax=Treponema sp. TaxID=166 RepID=UPI00388D0278